MDPALRARFRFLQWCVLAVGLVLAGRLIHLQFFKHEHYRVVAERTWTDEISLPPERGNLYDRGLRPLALSVSSWRVGVATSLIGDEEDGLVRLLSEVLDQDPGALRHRLRQGKGKHVVVSAREVLTRQEMMDLGAFRAITVEDLRARVYPFDGLGASLVGFFREDPVADMATGLERGLDEYLAGTPGRARLITTGKSGQNLGTVVREPARHGKNLVLTVDTDLQEIGETRLREAILRTGAMGGSVLILDPQNGDILAAASWPLMETRQVPHEDAMVWQNWNFIKAYEPGSVFKIFSSASLLNHGAVDTVMTFDCSDSDIGNGIHIRNDEGHAYGQLPFMPAFAKSSNIYFARAVANLRKAELYEDLLAFGFGQGTGIPYPGVATGRLRDHGLWQRRSKPTVAIGQEVSVTPLQLGMAVCAVANGGTLYAPRIIREVRDESGGVVEEKRPVPLREAIKPAPAALLREAMGRVILNGTGKNAREDWIQCGGKTGTAQKVREGDVGYTPNAYIASFAGIVPKEDPRLVVLTVLDEPQGANHYASLSAVPLFRDVVRDIRTRTTYLTGVPGARTAFRTVDGGDDMRMVPDVLHLSMPAAVDYLSRAGFQVAGGDKGGMVVQQIPLPGTRLPAGSTVKLATGPRENGTQQVAQLVPDFRGLSNRQARNLAARLGLAVAIEGAGYAVAQTPAPGTQAREGNVQIRMEAPW